MASDYPTSLDAFTTKTDKEDLYAASHMNDVQNAIVATQTELGTDVAGSRTDLKTRLAQCIADNGAMRSGTSFPVSPTPQDGDFFYRTDENTMYIYNGSDWDAQGTSLSNVVFAWSGVDAGTATGSGIYVGTSTTPDVDANISANIFLASDDLTGTPPAVLLRFKFEKIAGINTVTIHARMWRDSGTATCKVDIGGQNNTVTSTSGTPAWSTSTDIDVSGLSDGTVYDGTVTLNSSSSGFNSYLSAITLIAS